MRRAAVFALLLYSFVFGNVHAEVTHIRFGRFGDVTLYSRKPEASRVILFISGDEGWGRVVADMAGELSNADTLVAGIDARQYQGSLRHSREECSYPAAELEALSKEIQKRLNFPHYVLPVIIGYSAGASLAYASFAQAPPNTFSGAITFGFCPDSRVEHRFCAGTGLQLKSGAGGKGFTFLPARNLETRWFLFQGSIGPVCNPSVIDAFVKEVPRATVIHLPDQGHGISASAQFMTQLQSALTDLTKKETVAAEKSSSVPGEKPKDLPLIELPASGKASDSLAFIVTGDGGWASLDREVGTYLAKQGIAVVGFDSLQYFWTRRTPDQAARDFAKVMQYYLGAWDKQKAILVGYSFGADVMPFLASRLPGDLLQRVKLIALLGPSRDADFEFHVTEWLGSIHRKDSQPVLPEVKKLKGTKTLCFYGRKDGDDSLCTILDSSLATRIAIDGGHHFGGDYQSIAEKIVTESK